jgi:hypothetical protein
MPIGAIALHREALVKRYQGWLFLLGPKQARDRRSVAAAALGVARKGSNRGGEPWPKAGTRACARDVVEGDGLIYWSLDHHPVVH